MKDYLMKDAPIRFVNLIDGDCVNERDGKKIENGIEIPVIVEAPENCEVTLCGKPMTYVNGAYHATVALYGYRNTLLAKDITNGTEAKIVILYMPTAVGKYRFSSDDNILFLQDITENKDTYHSIFENPYLAIYKKAHDLYGAKVHLNLFYAFDEKGKRSFAPERTCFDLSMVTDKFKDEFAANADWLKLAFHSHAENPAYPYSEATAEKITEDCIRVHREIIRFAGPASISNSTTTHFGSGNRECVRALRALGYTSLTGYFQLREGKSWVSYYTPDDVCDHVSTRDFWYDTEEDMLFGRIDRVTNLGSLEEVMEVVRDTVAHPHRGGFVSVMIHEQYFYEDYKAHLPDFEARILEPCRYLWEHGYVGAHVTEMTREPNLAENPLFY